MKIARFVNSAEYSDISDSGREIKEINVFKRLLYLIHSMLNSILSSVVQGVD